MRSRAVRHAGRCIGLVVMAGVSGVAHAQETQTGVLASAGVTAETNPYNTVNTSGVQVAATAEVRPMIRVRDEQTTINLSALAQFRQFVRRYGLEDNYAFNADIVSRRSDRLTLRGTSAFSYSEGGFNGYGRPGLLSPDPVAITPDPLPDPALTSLSDVTILGQRTRIRSIDTGLGADARLTAYSNLSIDLSGRSMRFLSAAYNDYNFLGAELRYSHSLNNLFSVGLIGDVGKTNYLDLGQGDASSSSILASIDRRFGSRWSLSLAAGASFTNIEARSGQPEVHFSAVSARLRFCWQGEFSRFCLGGERSPQPAANGNVRVSDTVTADYSLRLSERERFSLSGSYAKTGRGHDIVGAPAVEFASASARYENDLNQKVTAFATTSVAKIFSPILRPRANVGAAIGLQIRFGALR